MKKIVTLIFIFSLAFVFTKNAMAQVTTGKLAVTVYETREDIDVLFENSLRVLDYLEGEDVEEPIFLSLISEDQLEILKGKGFLPRIIDENTDLSSYVLLYNPREDQAEKLISFGETIAISKHYTFLKLSLGEVFTHDGEAGAFFDIPFPEVIVTPSLRTKTATELTVTPVERDQEASSFPIAIVIAVVLLIISGVGVFIFLKKRKRDESFQ